MLKVAMICMLVAVVVLAVGVSLMKKNNALTFLLKTLTIIALVGLGFTVANFKDDFSGFSILVILSALPMFLSVFDLKQMFETKQTLTEENLEQQIEENTDEETAKKKKTHKNYLAECKTNLLCAIGIFLSAVCLSIATLYIGKETFFGALLGLLIGGAVTLVLLALGKIKNPFDIIFYVLIFSAIGLMASNIVLTFLYSFSITNIMFALGCVSFGVYAGLQTKYTKNYLTNIYYVGMVFFLLSILL